MSDMTMVERVARALCEASCEEWREGILLQGGGYDSDQLNNHWRFKARAAIEEMRTPTLEMWEAFGADIEWEVFPGYWSRAIDAALSEQKP